MELNKDDILKNINSFFGADNELAIKEAEHQIKIFEVIFEKEFEEYQKSKSKEIANPEKDSKNIKIIKSIKLFREDLKRKKDKRKTIRPIITFINVLKYLFGSDNNLCKPRTARIGIHNSKIT